MQLIKKRYTTQKHRALSDAISQTNTGFAAIFITLNGSRYIVKLLKRIVSKIPYHTHCVNKRYVLSYTQ